MMASRFTRSLATTFSRRTGMAARAGRMIAGAATRPAVPAAARDTNLRRLRPGTRLRRTEATSSTMLALRIRERIALSVQGHKKDRVKPASVRDLLSVELGNI